MLFAALTPNTSLGGVVVSITDVQTYGPSSVSSEPGGGCLYVHLLPSSGQEVEGAQLDLVFSNLNVGSISAASASPIPLWLELTDSFTVNTQTLLHTSVSLSNLTDIVSPSHLMRVDFEFASQAATPSTMDISFGPMSQLGQGGSEIASVTFNSVTGHSVNQGLPAHQFLCAQPTAVPEPGAGMLLSLVTLIYGCITKIRTGVAAGGAGLLRLVIGRTD